MNKQVTMQFIKMLTNLDGILVKAIAHADAKKFDVNNFRNTNLNLYYELYGIFSLRSSYVFNWFRS